jgi:hypothetical protein
MKKPTLATAQPETGKTVEEQADNQPTGVYCKLTSTELRARLEQIRVDLLGAVVAVDDLDSGYRFWFESSSDRLRQLAEFVDFESQCCPFLDFEISLKSEAKVVALSLTGPDGTRELLKAMVESASANGRDRPVASGPGEAPPTAARSRRSIPHRRTRKCSAPRSGGERRRVRAPGRRPKIPEELGLGPASAEARNLAEDGLDQLRARRVVTARVEP